MRNSTIASKKKHNTLVKILGTAFAVRAVGTLLFASTAYADGLCANTFQVTTTSPNNITGSLTQAIHARTRRLA